MTHKPIRKKQSQQPPYVNTLVVACCSFTISMECCVWTDNEVQAFLSIYSSEEIQRDFESGRRNNNIYENISVQLLQLGIHHTPKQCREKIKKLKQDYKKIKDHNNQNESDRRSGKWFVAMDAIFGDKPAFIRKAGTKNSAVAVSDGIASDTDTSLEVNDCKPRWKVESKSPRNTHSEEISLDMSVVEEDMEPESCISTPESSLLPQSRPVTPTQTRQRLSNPLSTGQATYTPTPASCQRSSSFSPHSRVRALVAEHQQGKQNRRSFVSPSEVEEQLLHIMTQPNTPVPPHVPREVEEMYYFSLSLVPKLNRLLPKNQTRAQIHILQYLADLELEDEQQRQQLTLTQPAFIS